MRDLLDTLNKVRTRLAGGHYANETAVREAVVLPILEALGWDTTDPVSVIREFTLGGRRVDYALSTQVNRPAIFVEVKGPREILGGDKQLFEYAFHQGIPIAILTDGQTWNFYLPSGEGSYEDRRLYKLDLLERSSEESKKILERYLSFEEVRSDRARTNAVQDYQRTREGRTAAAAIPKAWHEIIEEPDELLIELILDRVEVLSGHRPEIEQVEKFLLDEVSAPRAILVTKPAPTNIPPNLSQPGPRLGERQITFEISGKRHSAPNAKEAMISILKALAAGRQNFWEELSQKARTRERNHLARSRDAVYPNRPDLADLTLEISPGWFIGTNIANREKDRLVQRACECAKLQYGKDVKIHFPNVTA